MSFGVDDVCTFYSLDPGSGYFLKIPKRCMNEDYLRVMYADLICKKKSAVISIADKSFGSMGNPDQRFSTGGPQPKSGS